MYLHNNYYEVNSTFGEQKQDHAGPYYFDLQRLDPVHFWFAKTGPRSTFGLQKLDPVHFWFAKTGPSPLFVPGVQFL